MARPATSLPQIQNGGPFNLFFSADIGYPQKLEAAGLTEPGTIYEYATGRIVLLAPKGSPLDLKRGLAVPLDPQVKKIAIANPQHSPYGRSRGCGLKARTTLRPGLREIWARREHCADCDVRRLGQRTCGDRCALAGFGSFDAREGELRFDP